MDSTSESLLKNAETNGKSLKKGGLGRDSVTYLSKATHSREMVGDSISITAVNKNILCVDH